MPIILKITFLIFSMILIAIIFYSVNRGELQLKYAISWIVISFLISIAIIFPVIPTTLAKLFQFEVTSNFVYLAGFVVLFYFIFSITMYISKQSMQIKKITQVISINEFMEMQKELEQELEDEQISIKKVIGK